MAHRKSKMESMVGMNNFYRGKKVMVTGHTGFKGSWLTLMLAYKGADITGISLDPKNTKDVYNAIQIKNLCLDLRHDINDYEGLLSIFNKVKPEIVFHLAAQALVIDSYKYPLRTFETNIIGTANVLEACRNTDSVKAVIVVTSDKCYENREKEHAFTENDRLGGNDPYSSSKAACEIVTNAFRESYFILSSSPQVATVRAGNVIGGGDWAENRIVPDCISYLLRGEEIILRNPQSVRPWQYVLEPLHGYMFLATKLFNDKKNFSEAWNFGPGYMNRKSVRSLAEEVIKCWGGGAIKEMEEDIAFGEAGLLMLDVTKAREKLGWIPVLTFEESVEMSIAWYKAQEEGKDMQKFSLGQLNIYDEYLINKSRANDY